MKEIEPRKGVSPTAKVLRLLGGWIEVSYYPPRSHEEDYSSVPANPITDYSLITNAELKMAHALMHQRMFDQPK